MSQFWVQQQAAPNPQGLAEAVCISLFMPHQGWRLALVLSQLGFPGLVLTTWHSRAQAAGEVARGRGSCLLHVLIVVSSLRAKTKVSGAGKCIPPTGQHDRDGGTVSEQGPCSTEDDFLGYVRVLPLLQSCPALCDPVSCSLPGFSVHGVLQAKILEWVAISSSRGSSQPRARTRASYISCVGGFFTTAPPEKPILSLGTLGLSVKSHFTNSLNLYPGLL